MSRCRCRTWHIDGAMTVIGHPESRTRWLSQPGDAARVAYTQAAHAERCPANAR